MFSVALSLENEKYVSKGKFMNNDVISVITLPGLEVHLDDIFINEEEPEK